MKSRLLFASWALAIGQTANCLAATIAATPVDTAWLGQQGIPAPGQTVAAWRVADREGEHALVLSRKTGPSAQNPRSGRIEATQLTATYYGRTGARWTRAWDIRDGVDCPNLDSHALFYPQAVTFTDLNGDGRIEVTVAYHTFCGGGIDSDTVKVILREGQTKLAIRGESRVQYKGQAPFGGEHRHDDALLRPEMAAYKEHLDAVWRQVSDDKRP
jgi:hypothetical protein